ncbi:hypothetical protein FB45DRAFT_874013 [Roridomyces roridus]|uniref:Uncharacterized protein n=1 Tax=Roridomyces roridus TaxID=1738132 RepID=A0AAD7FBS2_9AGAR|nr:hypothetical protein FB45DRAFT_874013 [Roridomyces roridus]
MPAHIRETRELEWAARLKHDVVDRRSSMRGGSRPVNGTVIGCQTDVRSRSASDSPSAEILITRRPAEVRYIPKVPLLYARGTLFYLPFINSSSPAVGLEGGMLYDVLDSPESGSAAGSGLGSAIVDAVQLNMTCGYFADPVVNSTAGTITILGLDYIPAYTDIGTISTLQYVPDDNSVPANFSADNVIGSPFMSSALFYSTVPISDSAGNTGPLVDISGIQGLDGVAKIQIFGCSLGLVNGSVTVDSKSQVLSNQRVFGQKDSSVWSPFQETGSKAAPADPYEAVVDDWESWYISMPVSSIAEIFDPDPTITVAEMFFIERFNLLNSTTSSVTLHQFEDALAELVASMYWTRQ